MVGEISGVTRTEVIRAIRNRYREASKKDKSRMLDEFVATTGCHRKHAVRLLERGGNGSARAVPRGRKQARPLDADALAAIRATALSPRGLRGGSFETEETALKRDRMDIALASVMSNADLRISEVAALRWRDVLDAEDGAGLVYIERSKTDQAGEGAFVVITPDTLTALRQLRGDSEIWSDDDPVFGLSMSQISRRVDSMARAAGLGEGYSGHSGRVGLAIRMTRRGAPLQAVQTHGCWKSPSMPARYTRSEKALEALEWLV